MVCIREVERRAHGEVAVGGAGKVADLVGDPVGEIARARPRHRDRAQPGAGLLRCRGFLLRHRTGLDHEVEHLSGARRGLLFVAGRVEPGRRLQEAGDDRAFEQVELGRRFAEIAVRRGVDPIGAGAEIDPVEVDFEDLVLGEAVFEPQRQQRFADFAAEVALRRQEHDLGELLGDGAAALGEMAGAQIGEPGAQEADRIDAEMLVEAPVLGGDHRFRQKRRHLLQGQRLTEQIAKAGDEAAILGEDRDARAALGDRQLTGVGQGEGEIGERAAAENRSP